MSKRAKEAAMKAYPDILREAYSQGNGNEIILNWTEDRSDERRCFQEGYEQAEKDLALTWEDIREIIQIEQRSILPRQDNKEYYEEVLRRFIESKNK